MLHHFTPLGKGPIKCVGNLGSVWKMWKTSSTDTIMCYFLTPDFSRHWCTVCVSLTTAFCLGWIQFNEGAAQDTEAQIHTHRHTHTRVTAQCNLNLFCIGLQLSIWQNINVAFAPSIIIATAVWMDVRCSLELDVFMEWWGGWNKRRR